MDRLDHRFLPINSCARDSDIPVIKCDCGVTELKQC